MTNIKFTPLITCLFAVLFFTACAPLNQGGMRGPWTLPTPSDESPQNIESAIEDNVATPTRKPAMTNQMANLPAVNVAILLPLSGSNAALGQSMLQGAQLALFEMGYSKFNLMPRDTAGTAEGAANAATSAINDGAQLILGPLFADSVRAVKPIARAKNINVIAFSTDWTLADNNTFLMGFMPFSQVDRVARYALSKGYKNFGLIAPQDTYGNAVSGQFNEVVLKNGGTNVKSIRYNLGDSEISQQIATLSGSDLNAVFMPVAGSDIDRISSALSANGLTPDKVKRLGTGLWDDARIANQPNIQGAWFAAPSPSGRRAFEQKYMAAYGTQPIRIATIAYDATALAQILAKNGFSNGGNKPAYDYTSITNQNGFSGTDGVFRFNSNGIIDRNLAVLEMRNGAIIEIDRAPTRF